MVELSLREVGDGTELAVRHGWFATEARFDLHRQGWTESLDRLRDAVDGGWATPDDEADA